MSLGATILDFDDDIDCEGPPLSSLELSLIDLQDRLGEFLDQFAASLPEDELEALQGGHRSLGRLIGAEASIRYGEDVFAA